LQLIQDQLLCLPDDYFYLQFKTSAGFRLSNECGIYLIAGLIYQKGQIPSFILLILAPLQKSHKHHPAVMFRIPPYRKHNLSLFQERGTCNIKYDADEKVTQKITCRAIT